MNEMELEKITKELIQTFKLAGRESIDLYNKGLKIEIKDDNSPVTNGDIRVNELLSDKIREITPNIPIISEETVDLKKKINIKFFG